MASMTQEAGPHSGQDSRQDSGRDGTTRWSRRYLAGLDCAASGNAQAFGFSILITVTFGVVASAHGEPDVGELFGFALAAVSAFSALNLVAARLAFRRPDPPTPKRIILVATATDFLAVGGGVGAAVGIVAAIAGWPAWVLAPALASLVYALAQALEFAVGQAGSEGDAGQQT